MKLTVCLQVVDQFQSGECSNEEWREKRLSYTPSAGGFLPTKGVGWGWEWGLGKGGLQKHQ